MSEPGFREIQLSTKQVVFLFIAFVVAAVAVFLLGVSVGRGVNPWQTSAEATASREPGAEAIAVNPAAPGSTPQQADSLTYHDALQGKTPSTPPPPIPDAPPETRPTPTPAAPTATPVPTPASKPAAPAAAAVKPPPAPKAAGTLYVQVDSFGSKANADRQVAQLKAKGIAAFVFEVAGTGAKYKTRVGPFADRATVDAMLARLRKEGYKPSAIR